MAMTKISYVTNVNLAIDKSYKKLSVTCLPLLIYKLGIRQELVPSILPRLLLLFLFNSKMRKGNNL